MFPHEIIHWLLLLMLPCLLSVLGLLEQRELERQVTFLCTCWTTAQNRPESPFWREKSSLLRSLIFPGERTFGFPLLITKPRVFKDTELGGYSVKYNLRYPGKYLHLNALWGVVQLPRMHCPLSHFGHSRKGNCFCQFARGLKYPTLSSIVRGGLEELTCKRAIKMLIWTTFSV